MRRCLLIILIVAALSAWIARAERVAGATTAQPDWVRTSTGWEHRAVLNAERPRPPLGIHPGLIAAFQLGASLFVLLAFPGRATPSPTHQTAGDHRHLARHRRGVATAEV